MMLLKLCLQCTEMFMRNLAEIVTGVVDYRGRFVQGTSKPDGTMRKVMDVSRIKKIGWEPKTNLRSGIALVYENFLIRPR